jgi:transposase
MLLFPVSIHLPDEGMGMGLALQITRTDYPSDTQRTLASKCCGAQVGGLPALVMVLDGHTRDLAASSSGMDRQNLRDWGHRYNNNGIDGLKTRLLPGRKGYLTEPQKAELYELVVNGPDPAINGMMCWRCADLVGEGKCRFNVEVHESTIGKWLNQLGLARLQPWPVHPKRKTLKPKRVKKIRRPAKAGIDRRHGRDAG